MIVLDINDIYFLPNNSKKMFPFINSVIKTNSFMFLEDNKNENEEKNVREMKKLVLCH